MQRLFVSMTNKVLSLSFHNTTQSSDASDPGSCSGYSDDDEQPNAQMIISPEQFPLLGKDLHIRLAEQKVLQQRPNSLCALLGRPQTNYRPYSTED